MTKTDTRARRLIGDALVATGVLGRRDLKRALDHQREHGGRLGEIVVELGLADERSVAEALAAHLDLPFVDLRHERSEPDALVYADEDYARQWAMVPLRLEDGTLVVAVADPSDDGLVADLHAITHLEVRPVVAARSDVLRTIDRSYQAFGDVEAQARAFQERVRPTKEQSTVPALETLTAAAPAVQIVNLLVEQGLRDRASDIHLEPQEDRLRVRFRVDGTLHDVASLPSEVAPSIASRIKVMASMNIVERNRPQDGQFQLTIDGRQVDTRAATTSTIWGEKVVLRLLPKQRDLLGLPDLGMSPDVHEDYGRLIRSPFGMIIVAGPTGSGKTTTLYASLSEMDRVERNIMTIEDPVEYVFADINQIQIRQQAGVTFATGLKAILRQDPDVILVGEMRDVETARIGVQSALTGHFVLSSLHATDSVSALMRFVDMGIEPFLVTAAVSGIVAQRLLRRVCPHCSEEQQPTAQELAFYRSHGGSASRRRFLRGVGCNFCGGTGYLGRVGIFELLRMTEAVKRLVVEAAPQQQVRAAALEDGMTMLVRRAIERAENGVTTLTEIMRTLYEAE